MSLQSDSELYRNMEFRGKLTQAIAKALFTLASSGDDEQKAYARSRIYQLHMTAEQLSPIVLTFPEIDSAASDATIEAAALKVVKAAV
jgi:hypothetical protein